MPLRSWHGPLVLVWACAFNKHKHVCAWLLGCMRVCSYTRLRVDAHATTYTPAPHPPSSTASRSSLPPASCCTRPSSVRAASNAASLWAARSSAAACWPATKSICTGARQGPHALSLGVATPEGQLWPHPRDRCGHTLGFVIDTPVVELWPNLSRVACGHTQKGQLQTHPKVGWPSDHWVGRRHTGESQGRWRGASALCPRVGVLNTVHVAHILGK